MYHSLVFSLLSGVVLFAMTSCGSPSTSNQQANQAQQTQQTQPTPSAPTGGRTSAVNDPASIIPEFTFYTLRSGIRFEKKDLEESDRHVFILFDPGCLYCQHEARDIGKNLSSFENTSFYFVSMNDPGLMASFFSRYAPELENQPHVHMLYDRNIHFVNRFHVPGQYPATYVYDGKQQIRTYWNGVKSAEEIVQAIIE